MERLTTINAYENDNGNKYVVVTTPEGKVYSVSYGLVKYALDNVKKISHKK